MEPVLTQEELEAIYSAMKADAGPPRAVDDYALAGDNAYNVRSLKQWTDVAKRLCSPLEMLFTGTLGARGKVEIESVEIVDDDRIFDDALSPGGPTNVVSLDESDPDFEFAIAEFSKHKIAIGLEKTVAGRYVARRTGASSITDEDSEQERGITLLERRLLGDLYLDLISIIAKVAPEISTARLTRLDSEEYWANREPRGAWINAKFSSANHEGVSISVRGPAGLFMASVDEAVGKKTIERNLKETKVELVAELGTFEISVYDLWNIKPGTLIPLGVAVGDPLKINVAGVWKLQGSPLVSRGNIAVRLLKQDRSKAIQ